MAVADADEARLAAFREENPGVAAYQDYQDMMNREKPEIVSVCTPTETHARIVRNVVRYASTKVVFCEKPLAASIRDASRVVRACHYYGVKLACNLTRRWDRAYRRIKVIADGKDETWRIGRPLAFSGRFSGDPVGDGVHMADLANWYGRRGTSVSMENVPTPYLVFEADLWGEGGLVRVLHNGEEIQLWFAEESGRYPGFRELASVVDLEEAYDFRRAMLDAVDDLAKCATSDKQPDCTGTDGFYALGKCLEMEALGIP